LRKIESKRGDKIAFLDFVRDLHREDLEEPMALLIVAREAHKEAALLPRDPMEEKVGWRLDPIL
jgi:hypothetical protein